MLVVSRKQAEGVRINHDVLVTVLSIHGNKVRLGIDAPAATGVHRTEVYEAIQNRRAERLGPSCPSARPG